MHKDLLAFASTFSVDGEVLEIGSLNVKGTVRDVVPVDIGIDIRKGKGVDVVLDACDAVDYFGEDRFDGVVSTDALEHSKEWKCFLQNALSVLKKDGLLLVTAAAPRKGRHDYPNDYWRFSMEMWRHIFKEQDIISEFDHSISNGVIIRKRTDMLLTDFDPLPVLEEDAD